MSSEPTILEVGKSGIVYVIDSGSIKKEIFEDGDRDRERRAYERLGSHPNIAEYRGSKGDFIFIERGQPFQEVCRKPGQMPIQIQLRWLKDAAAGLKYVHEKGIVHGDFGSSNLILVHDRLKLIDFEGCEIDGEEGTSLYQWYNYKPSTPEVCIQTDIFAYGCLIYEIITGKPPHYDLEDLELLQRGRLAIERYERNEFPNVTHLPLGKLMNDCWHGKHDSMSEVIQALKAASWKENCAQFLNMVKQGATRWFQFLCVPLKEDKLRTRFIAGGAIILLAALSLAPTQMIWGRTGLKRILSARRTL